MRGHPMKPPCGGTGLGCLDAPTALTSNKPAVAPTNGSGSGPISRQRGTVGINREYFGASYRAMVPIIGVIAGLNRS